MNDERACETNVQLQSSPPIAHWSWSMRKQADAAPAPVVEESALQERFWAIWDGASE